MNKKCSIYTRAGDNGCTTLASGTKVQKHDSRVELYGSTDELNSLLGVIVSGLKKHEILQTQAIFLEETQHHLFALSSNLACEASRRQELNIPAINTEWVKQLEEAIDGLDAGLPPLKNFIIPGGSELGARLHVARTHCRKLERLLCAFAQSNIDEIPINGMDFINRLSDFLFVLARYTNNILGAPETIWKK